MFYPEPSLCGDARCLVAGKGDSNNVHAIAPYEPAGARGESHEKFDSDLKTGSGESWS